MLPVRAVELLSELHEASDILGAAVDRYMSVCVGISSYHVELEGGNMVAKSLLDSVLLELSSLSIYEKNFQNSGAALRRVRNQCPKRAPINTLPFEIMTRIFSLSTNCALDTPGASDLVYPGILLRVCNRWRNIALASPQLWSHIDMAWSQALDANERTFRRAKLLVAQSSLCPLELHIKDSIYLGLGTDKSELADFCRSVAPRVQSFALRGDVFDMHHSPLWWLDPLLSRFMAGTLTQFCIWHHSLYMIQSFISTTGSTFISGDRWFLWSSVPQEHFENVLARVTSLKLRGIYIPWTSLAYHGLVELCLGTWHNVNSSMSIKESDLAAILKASPGLQTLELGLDVVSSEESFRSNIVLEHLEVLRLTSHDSSSKEALLRVIRPGQLPLRLFIESPAADQFNFSSQVWIEFAEFIAQSNIILLHIEFEKLTVGAVGETTFDSLEMLPLLPRLEVLVLVSATIGRRDEDDLEAYDVMSYPSMLADYDHPPLHQQLRQLRLTRCRINWGDFRHAFEIHPTEKLVLDDCQAVVPHSRKQYLENVLGSLSCVVESVDVQWGYEDDTESE